MIRSSESPRKDSGNVISLPRLMVPSARLMCSGGYPKIIKCDISSDVAMSKSAFSLREECVDFVCYACKYY